MTMFAGYFEVSVNFNVENRWEKFIILISILYAIYRIKSWAMGASVGTRG